MNNALRITSFVFALALLALVSVSSVHAADQVFVYGDTTAWYTYDRSGGAGYGYPSLPQSYYYNDGYDSVYRATTRNADGTGQYIYSYAPVRTNRWSCVGSGCGRTPYVATYSFTREPARIYDYTYGNSAYGIGLGYGNAYGMPAIYQPW